MRQPAAIVDWWSAYDSLDAVRREVASEEFEDRDQLLYMALRTDTTAGLHCQYLVSWERNTTNGRVEFPVQNIEIDGRPAHYLGKITSYNAKWHRPAVTWALTEVLRLPTDNRNRDVQHPPNWSTHYCVSVVSWFWPPDVHKWNYTDMQAIKPPPGFPIVVTYNGYEREGMRMRAVTDNEMVSL